MSDRVLIKRALVSLFDKKGIEDLASVFKEMKIPDNNKMRIILSQDNNDDYMSISDEDILYQYVKIFGNKIPKKEKE